MDRFYSFLVAHDCDDEISVYSGSGSLVMWISLPWTRKSTSQRSEAYIRGGKHAMATGVHLVSNSITVHVVTGFGKLRHNKRRWCELTYTIIPVQSDCVSSVQLGVFLWSGFFYSSI
jgi:hypothetical protein